MKKDESGRRQHAGQPERPALGLEAEFACLVEGQPVDPAVEFGDPRVFIGRDAMHRTGTSYHLPTGGAVYFDTGVIELVTPVIELQRSAASQAVRSLWEGIAAVRKGLDRWSEAGNGHSQLVGFSTHYNVSLPHLGDGHRIAAMAGVLIHMIPLPVILFATNRRSTGVGVRPRPGRVEITADFTPDAALMAATTVIITAAIQEVATWSRMHPSELRRRGFPTLATIRPVPHSSRSGWLVRAPAFDADPFTTSPDIPRWRLAGGERVSWREGARRTVDALMPRVQALAEPATLDLIRRVLDRRHPSLLDFDDRPAAYENVGRVSLWQEPDPRRPVPRSLYEEVMRDAMQRKPLKMDGSSWRPVATRGWTRILYRSDDGRRRVLSVDDIVRLRTRR